MQRVLPFGLMAILITGCDTPVDELLSSTITGSLKVDGDEPGAYKFTLYPALDNLDAFDASYCDEANVEGECWGRVQTKKLTDAAKIGEVKVSGKDFELVDVPTDLAYILVVTGDDPAVQCSTDVVGFDENTKVVHSGSAIALSVEGGVDSFQLPRPVRLSCAAPATEPEAPPTEEVEPVEEPSDPGAIDVNNDIQPPPVVAWTSFVATGKAGSPSYGDATTGSAQASAPCGDEFPPVIEVAGTVENASAEEAFIRIQFGTGEDATYRTIPTPIVDGQVHQAISLSGGYSIVQLDTNEELDGDGESYTMTFCEPSDPPAQEMLVLLSWDRDDTDVDLHLLSENSEVAYYSMSQSWGDLDIDDIDGFGPETFTSTPETSGNLYEVKVHYYSDHGNGPTNVTARVVYFDATTGSTCDVTSTMEMASYAWWSVGVFGPGLTCPE